MLPSEIKKGRVYRNAKNKKLYYCFGIYPNLLNEKDSSDAVVILRDIFAEEHELLHYMSLKEFTKQVHTNEGLVDRFILQLPPKEKVEVAPEMRRIYEMDAVEIESKKIKLKLK